MAIVARRASDVRINEVDLSTQLAGVGGLVAAQVQIASRGPLTPRPYTSLEDYLSDFGSYNAAVSFGQYTARDFFLEGGTLWGVRAIGTGYKYSALLIKLDVNGNTVLQGLTSGVTDPAQIDWDGIIGAGESPVYVITPRKGPGSFGNNIAVELLSENLSPPTNLQVTSTTIGGSLSSGNYEYAVSAINKGGSETLISTPAAITVGSATSTNTVTLTWDLVVGAIGYKVYGRATSGSIYYMATVGVTTSTWTDFGVIAPVTTQAPITNAANLDAASMMFTLKVYDYSKSSTLAIETYNCSVTDQTDDTGAQMEPTQRINPFSKEIYISSNVSGLFETPVLHSANKVKLAGGASGAAPTAADVVSAWQVFLDKETYALDVLINAGYTSVTVQKAMESVASYRGDCYAWLDTPSTSQSASGVVDFRNLSLNINSSYAALAAQDLLEQDDDTGKLLYVPPSGAHAGLQARAFLSGRPWFSIAGLQYGIYNGNVLDVRYRYTDADATRVYQSNISYSRVLQGSGISLWEQNTLLSASSAFQFISIRVLSNIIKRASYRYLMYQLQQQNDDILAGQIKLTLSNYLDTVQAGRGISSYQVISNASNNPPAMKNSGIRVITIILTPIIPVREIQLTLGISKEGVTLDEATIASL